MRLLVEETLAGYVSEKLWHPRQKLIKKRGGRLELHIPVANTRDIVPWILSLGEFVKVLAPLELGKTVQQRHRAAARSP